MQFPTMESETRPISSQHPSVWPAACWRLFLSPGRVLRASGARVYGWCEEGCRDHLRRGKNLDFLLGEAGSLWGLLTRRSSVKAECWKDTSGQHVG